MSGKNVGMGEPKAGVTYEEKVEEALCFGWIDSRPNTLDADHHKLWLAPRRAKSVWSAINKEPIERLTATDRMTPAGLAKIEAAKADGSWVSLDSLEELTVPDDFAMALDAVPRACANFDTFPKGTRTQILYWIREAKRPETRAKLIAETARLAAQNIRGTEWRPKVPGPKART